MATIRLAGTAIEVELLEEREGSEVTYEWVYRIPEDEEAITSIEKEQYSTANNTFALVAGPAESFDPPIPLIKFPFAIGDNYEWKGTHRLGVTEKPASATINTQTDTLNLSVGKFEVVLVTVNLNVQTGNPAGTDSIFKFWFKPGDGIVKREFGVSSSREPRESEAPEDRLEE